MHSLLLRWIKRFLMSLGALLLLATLLFIAGDMMSDEAKLELGMF